jgi:hypothetical protein
MELACEYINETFPVEALAVAGHSADALESPFVQHTLTSPNRNGGVGLVDAVQLAHTCFFAAAATTAPHIRLFGLPRPTLQTSYYQAITQAHAFITPKMSPLFGTHAMCPSPADFFEFYSSEDLGLHASCKLQKNITKSISEASRQDFALHATQLEKSIIGGASGIGASTYLRIGPNCPCPNDSDFQLHLTVNLGIGHPPDEAYPEYCSCGEHNPSTHHFLACSVVNAANGAWIYRHDMVTDALADTLRSFGTYADLEPTCTSTVGLNPIPLALPREMPCVGSVFRTTWTAPDHTSTSTRVPRSKTRSTNDRLNDAVDSYNLQTPPL